MSSKFIQIAPKTLAEPARSIGIFDAVNLVVGAIVGSGIFLVSSEIARDLPSPQLILGVWLVTGLISFCGALAFAELGAMLPEDGGQYVYLRESYGPLTGFVFNWTSFLVIQTGSNATLAVGFAIYLGALFPAARNWQSLTAVAVICLLSILNILGVREGVWFQTLCTILRVAGILLIVGAAFLHPAHAAVAPIHAGPITWTAVSAAMAACFWTYEGWYILGFVAGEVKRPQQNIFIALTCGMAIVMSLYLLVNVAYLRTLSVATIAGTERVANLVAETTMGRAGTTLVLLTILISMGGSINAGILSAPRLTFALARDGLFFKAVGQLHPRWKTPVGALLMQCVWTVILALSGKFEELYSYVIFASWLFYALAVGGVIVLRRRHPDWPRPYRMWGYPFAPLAFVAFALWFLFSTLVSAARPSMIGAGIVAAGIPVYLLCRRSNL
jgi:APA family basic amino acid/polyamine antiporter